ncbi:zona pellucida sperm-binding protein 3-like isoform X1 [Clarias gariepinus]|uniref:zona pellucida sperm-binding protein 3-like isoform X1 n=1 Tax=Clarias gariepinus TaxID=13013 RepID=UPI00234D70D3|nr:zona pellucida sperm-binding protein 3-like isoform X1 [Clarias gariepinus]
MGFNYVGVSVVLLVAVGLSTAQVLSLGHFQVPAGFQPNAPGQVSPQGSVGIPSQLMQSVSQIGSLVGAPLGLQLQTPLGSQQQQVLQHLVKNLTWRYPTPPKIPTPPTYVNPPGQGDSIPTQGVTARCNETAVHVEVSTGVFGSSTTLNVAALTLGGCAATGMDASSRFLIYEAPLYGCNSALTVSLPLPHTFIFPFKLVRHLDLTCIFPFQVTADELVYIFTLGVASAPISGTPILRNAGIGVFIECHYPRFHNVSSNALLPAWIPFASAQAAEELLVFSLRLMMDDWVTERTSNQYYLGQLINIKASVMQFNHVPLRVLIDGCVATAVPDLSAVPRYSFIENHGCLIDTKITHSGSRFMPQTQANELGFQLEAFTFQQSNSSLVYIACILKATAASASADAEHKACSFSNNGWTAAYGSNQVCSCCDSSCAMRKGRDLSAEQGFQVEKEVSLGPIMILR